MNTNTPDLSRDQIPPNRLSRRHVACATVVALLVLRGGIAWSQQAKDYPLGDIPLSLADYSRHLMRTPGDLLDALPASYDARTRGIVTPAKDQGVCGSCWAFASVGAIESHLLMKNSALRWDLSEQQQLSCNTSQRGCEGGSSWALLFWETTGPVSESCFPYTGTDATTCSSSCNSIDYRVDNWHTVSTTTADFKASCYNKGPSYWRFDVHQDFYDYWNGTAGQVYRNTGYSPQGGHAVLIIGWDDVKRAFLCKNSWGATTGPNKDGTFWIAYDNHVNNLNFGMANFDLVYRGPFGPLPSLVFVDWLYSGTGANGSLTRPYQSMVMGYAAVAESGTMRIRGGNYMVGFVMDKPLLLEPYDGNVLLDGTTPPSLRGPRMRTDGTFVFSFAVVPGRRYQVFATTNLVNWEIWKDFVAETDTFDIVDDKAAVTPQRFFKVVMP